MALGEPERTGGPISAGVWIYHAGDCVIRPFSASVPARPVVVFDPAMRFGRAQIAGVPVEAIGEVAWAGESVDEIAVEYDLTRPQVVVACWFLGTHGTRKWRTRFGGWAGEVSSELWHSRYDVADPPDRRSDGQG